MQYKHVRRKLSQGSMDSQDHGNIDQKNALGGCAFAQVIGANILAAYTPFLANFVARQSAGKKTTHLLNPPAIVKMAAKAAWPLLPVCLLPPERKNIP